MPPCYPVGLVYATFLIGLRQSNLDDSDVLHPPKYKCVGWECFIFEQRQVTTIHEVTQIVSYLSLLTIVEVYHGLKMTQQKTLIFTYGIQDPGSRNIL